MEKREIIARIKELHAAGEALNIHAVKRHHPELIKAAVKIRPYWGWKRALEEAGISYDDVRFVYHPSVRCRICGFEGSSLSSHLRFKHRLQPGEYREKFPGEETESELRLYKFFGRREIIRKPPIPAWESVLTDEYVYDKVAEYRRRGFSITTDFIHRNDRPLYMHALRNGQNWPEFCAFMGPEYAKEAETPKPPTDPLRSREETLQALRDRELNGFLPTEKTLKTRLGTIRRDVLRHFPSYEAAAKVLGFKISKGKRLREGARDHARLAAKYPRGKILKIVGEMCTDEFVPRKVDLEKKDPDLVIAIQKNFGKMSDVYQALGLSASRMRLVGRRYPDKASIIEEIQRRDKAGLPLGGRFLNQGPDRDARLQSTARRMFGSWREALTAAGVSSADAVAWKRDRVPVFATPEAVVEELKRRSKEGAPVRASHLQKGAPEDQDLLLDSRLHFGPHVEAMKAAGLLADGRPRTPKGQRMPPKPKGPRKPRPPTGATREEVLEFIQDRVDKGLHLNCDKIARSGNARITHAARRIFGDWRTALRELGIDVPDNRAGARAVPDLTREEIFAFMHKRVEDGIGLSSFQLSKENPGYRYYRTAKKMFGNWKNALREAGFDPKEIIQRFNPSPPKKPKPPKVPKVKPPPRPLFSKEFILETMRTRLNEGKPMAAREVAKEKDGNHFIKSARAHFGDWKALSKKVGVPGAQPPTKEEIIAFIHARVADGKSVSSPQLTLVPQGSRIYTAGLKTFGSWHKTLEAAGYDPKEILARFKRRPRRLPKFLQPHAPGATKEAPPSPPEAPAPEEQPSSSESGTGRRGKQKAHEFPTREATAAEFARILAAAGADTSEFGDDFEDEPEDPEKRRIIDALRERAASGKAMKYGVICLGPPAHRNRPLYDSAVNTFGSWKAALEAAGMR